MVQRVVSTLNVRESGSKLRAELALPSLSRLRPCNGFSVLWHDGCPSPLASAWMNSHFFVHKAYIILYVEIKLECQILPRDSELSWLRCWVVWLKGFRRWSLAFQATAFLLNLQLLSSWKWNSWLGGPYTFILRASAAVSSTQIASLHSIDSIDCWSCICSLTCVDKVSLEASRCPWAQGTRKGVET